VSPKVGQRAENAGGGLFQKPLSSFCGGHRKGKDSQKIIMVHRGTNLPYKIVFGKSGIGRKAREKDFTGARGQGGQVWNRVTTYRILIFQEFGDWGKRNLGSHSVSMESPRKLFIFRKPEKTLIKWAGDPERF